ncbi:plasmid mobilization protein [Eisenbergiella sp.]
MAKRKRDVPLLFWVSKQEKELIEEKMTQLGTDNLSAYLRKMAIDGLVVKLELPELREMISLLRYSSNNLNQLTRHVHETGHLYDTDLEDMRQSYERLWEAANQILTSLAAIK